MKYFIFKNDFTVGKYEKKGEKEEVIIPAGQPFEITRDISEHGYVQLIGGLSAYLDAGHTVDNVAVDAELGMWKILAKYNEYLYYKHFDSIRHDFATHTKTVEDMWLEVRKKDATIRALLHALKTQ